MTSTYDSLGMLYYEAKENPSIKQLVLIVYDYAIAEINKVDPDKFCWIKWLEREHGITFYAKLYSNEDAELIQKASFLSDAHYILDHTKEYHLKTLHDELDYIIGRLKDWFVTYKDREYMDRFYSLADFNKNTRDRYPKVFKELKHLIEIRIIEIPEWDKRTRGKIVKW